MSDVVLPLLVVLPIVAATLPLVLGLKFEDAGWSVAAATTTVLLGLSAFLAREVFVLGSSAATTRVVHELGGWQRPYGIELVGDELSAVVALLVALVAVLTLVYSRVAGPRGNAFYAGYLLLTGGLMGMVLTGDMFNLFVFLEIVGLTTYALVAADDSGASAYASLKYLMLGTVGASLYLIGVGYAFLATGTLNMVDLQNSLAEVGYTDPLVQASYAFVVAGFALKIALFPVHTWQPDAYQRAPDAVTMFISALVSTTAAYALLRVTYSVFTVEFLAANQALTTVLLVVAGTSTVAGSALAAMQSDLKRLFAYSSVAQFGMIVAAVALANPTALRGAIVHLVGHGLLKFGLFLGVALLSLGYGTRTVADLSSLAQRAPYTAGALAVLGLALVGIPPSIGFLGKWYIAVGAVQSAGDGSVAGLAIAGVILVSTLLTLAYVARLIERLYFAGLDLDAGPTRQPQESPGFGLPTGADTKADGGTADRTEADGAGVAPRGGTGVPGIPDRVPLGAFLVLVGMTVLVVALGFAGLLAADLLDPFIGSVFQ